MNFVRNSRAMVVTITALFFGLNNVLAASSEYEINTGAWNSDNIARTETAVLDDTAVLLGFKIQARHESRGLNWELMSDLEYRDYRREPSEEEVIGSMRAGVDISMIPETVTWVIDDSFGTLQFDPLRAETPENRENVNRFATGPDLELRLSTSTAFELGARYVRNDFSVSDTDHDVAQAKASLIRAISAKRTISLNASADSYQFDEADRYLDYDRQLIYIGLASELSRGSVSVAVGHNEISGLAVTADGLLVDVDIDRALGGSTTLNLRLRQGLTDVGELIGDRESPGISFGETQRASTVSDPFEHRLIGASLSFSRTESSWYLGTWYRSDEYLTQTSLDNDRAGLRASFERGIGRTWKARLSGTFQRTEFANTFRRDDDLTILFGLSRQMSRRTRIDVDLGRFSRYSTENNFDYVENVASIHFAYGTIE